MKNNHRIAWGLSLVSTCVLLFWVLSYRGPHLQQNRGVDLRQAMRIKSHPTLSIASAAGQLAAPRAVTPPTLASQKHHPPTQKLRGPLTDDTLAMLRRTTVLPKFPEREDLPHERKILLANRRVVVPEKATFPAAPTGLQTPTARNTTPYLVTFSSPLDDALRAAVAAKGVCVRGFIPNNALLVELTPALLAELPRWPSVTHATEFLPSDKIQPFLAAVSKDYSEESQMRVTLETFSSEDVETVAACIRASGGEVERVVTSRKTGAIQAVLTLGSLSKLSSMAEVHWIEERVPFKLFNDQAANASHLQAAKAGDPWLLTGKGEHIGHADTGLDTGNIDTLHSDLRERVEALFPWGRPGDASDTDGHGTHTAGSLLGTGAASGGQFKGIAWKAGLIHQSVMDSSGNLGGLPFDLGELFMQSYALGGRVHSDSWGSDSYGDYDYDCAAVDAFTWNYPDHLCVFAAGNAGVDHVTPYGVIDLGSCGSPANAKNSVSVGASENDRPSGSGGGSSYSWNSAWPADYPYEPIASDLLSYSATLSPYLQGMAAFSSRGPTLDGRIKPDVVAPGTDIISTRSSLGGVGWDAYLPNTAYCFNGGTSMATPLIAGSAALLRQYAVERGGFAHPTAALIKAMLVGGARSLTPGQYGTGSVREIPAASPNNVEGWGQVSIADTVHPIQRMVKLVDRLSPLTGQTNILTVTIAASNAPLDVALSWIDYPAELSASKTLVNDLDLLVVDPSGTTYYPNGLSQADTVNTVEALRIPSAIAGAWQIKVIGKQVVYSGGPAAVYVRGAFESTPIVVHEPLTNKTFLDSIPTPVTLQIQSLSPLTNHEARVFWSTGTEAGPTGSWSMADATWRSNALYQADLPAQQQPKTLWYYIQLQTSATNILVPAAAPATAYSFKVDEPVSFSVNGLPMNFGSVSPAYGIHTLVSGVPFEADASQPYEWLDGIRWTVTGWKGTGDVPSTGATNRVSLTLYQDSTLSWQWELSYALTNQDCLLDTATLLTPQVTWHRPESRADLAPAFDLGWLNDEPYGFCGWTLDGARQPDATSSAANPLTGILMDRPHCAQAGYLPFWQDSNGNDLMDWYELRYFGSTDAGAQAGDDLDGDTWTNLGEALDNTDPRDIASVPTPPSITVRPLEQIQTIRAPWTVTADVRDNFTVTEVYLVSREKNSDTEQWTPMTEGSNSVFSAELAPPHNGALRVYYWVVARDLLGYYMAGAFDSVSPTYQVLADYDTPWGAYDAPADPFYLLYDAATNLTVSVSNLAGPDLLWEASVSAPTTPFSASDPLWQHGGDDDSWHVTQDRTWNGDTVWYCGDPATHLYANGCYAWLDTPAWTVGTEGGVLFRHWIKMEYDSGLSSNACWDGCVLLISTDLGETFSPIEPLGGYPNTIEPNPESPFEAGRPCFAGVGTGWQTVMVDLRAYAGQTVILRFVLGADGYTTDEGWYIAGVTPFSFDASPLSWPTLSSANGQTPDLWTTPLTLHLDPAPLAYNNESVSLLRIKSNDPFLDTFLWPLTVRRGCVLSAQSQGHGQVNVPLSMGYRLGESSVFATPELYYHVSDWLGDVAGATQTVNRLFVPMDRSRQVTAVFGPNLTPHQVPEFWMAQYGWTNQFDLAEQLDPDNDRFATWAEFIAGTDPTNTASRFLATIALSNGIARIHWTPDLGAARRYTVEGKASITNQTWGATNAQSRLFRVHVEMP